MDAEVMQHDDVRDWEGVESRMLEIGDVQEILHLESHQLTDGGAYLCSLCVYSGDVYVLRARGGGGGGKVTEVSGGTCEYVPELEEGDQDPFVQEVFLGFYLRPTECFTGKVLQGFYLGQENKSKF